jgi:hypothetical protein
MKRSPGAAPLHQGNRGGNGAAAFEETDMAYITTPSELTAAIREAYLDGDDMEPSEEIIVRQVVLDNTFGGAMPTRNGKIVLAALRLAVSTFCESQEGEEGDDDDESFYARRRVQEYLDVLKKLSAVEFQQTELEQLKPLDRQRFYRLLLAATDWGRLFELYRQAIVAVEEPGEEETEAAQ